ncbi:MAG TPA: O-antigen ligase family protein [Candidatus Acidoferrales bacterium]|nr:O-antigen ligase family protein [Candidatus Acidoferrales bacterium]
MIPSPTLRFEIAFAGLIVLAFLWTNVECGLFLYAFALGFPDVALPLGSTINIRVDDVLIASFLARTILWRPAPLSRLQRHIVFWQGIFLGICLLSIAVETALGSPPEGYDAAKMAGCAVILFVLPRLLQTERRMRFFVAGLMCAGVALAIQIYQHLGANSSYDAANFQQFKSAASFTTWNPNTTGQAAMLLAFAAGLGGIIFSKTPANRILWPCLAAGFALLPALVFVRGTSLSLAAAFLLFLSFLRRWKGMLLFAAACLCAFLYFHSSDSQLVKEAAAVNLTTGEGFSNRYDRWAMAIRAIQAAPFIGHGFGQALAYLTLIGSEGVAHDAYLTVWLELGMGGLLFFLAAIFQFVHGGWFLYRDPRFQAHGALILALIFALGLDSIGLSTLYWEKLATIALCLAAAVIGLCEKNGVKIPERAVLAAGCEPSEQYT